ncbi:Nuclear control of ATPase protein 2 [Apophysomyces ossiformis]|uniref:Nuclear control of ATPase protein 2 n=1 Tax=Apophysomyces ossiformis TaxID=679940 RepID=A0A8H7BK57_9FUNG|nr:Nuclear control of ATPase protein 2 [Apophysomyces ossiformis]
MATYVNEQLSRLDGTLAALFEQQDIGLTTETLSLEDGIDKSRFLSNNIRAIDLSSTTLPCMEEIRKQLEIYIRLESQADPALEWLFVAKCTIAVYGLVISQVLNSTLPLSEAINYWEGIYGSTVYETYYALQTSPWRLASLAVNTVHKVSTTQIGIKSLLTSQEHIWSNLFPVYAHEQRRARLSPFGLINVTMKHRPLYLHMIHDEIDQKKTMLRKFREQQAARLGLLIKMMPRLTTDEDFTVAMGSETSKCLQLMRYVLDSFASGTAVDNTYIETAIDAVETTSATDIMTVAQGLYQLLSDWPAYEKHLASVQETYGPPSRVTRYWVPALALYFSADYMIQYISDRREDIVAWSKEAANTVHDFVVNWIWEPVLNIWDTIRLKDQRLTVLSKDGLRSDLESLERMVVDYARDHYHFEGDDIVRLAAQVREGDMSLILKAYEQEMKRPLKNAIAGDLIQTLLIQVQKTKVDVDLAMSALDKLLKSNELNFAFLAVAPSMLLTWASLNWLRNIYQRRSGQRLKQKGRPIRAAIRRIDRILNLAVEHDNDQLLDCQTQGSLLYEVHLLRSYTNCLPKRHAIRELFIEDLRDLENPELTQMQKLRTIARMNRFYTFTS